MDRRAQMCLGLLLTLCSWIAVLYPEVTSASTCEHWVAKVVSVQGSVQVKKVGETNWQPVKLNDTYCPGDTIRVLEKSRADIALVNQPILRLDQDTTITLNGVKEDKASWVQVLKGAAHFFSRAAKSLVVNTAFVNAGVEGTEFFVRVEDDNTFISIFEGKVLASNEAGKLTITSGQSAVAMKGKAPEFRVVVRPRDAVQWTLYYPPVFYFRPSDFGDLPKTEQTAIRKSLEAFEQGDFSTALQGVDELREKTRDPRLLTFTASLLLGVGRVNEAKADIDKALKVAPNHSDALALQSVIAVTQNQNSEALNLAKKAVEADPKSASARVALSYAEQGNFNIKGALDGLLLAVQLSPENALAWARLAEVWLMFGELDKSLEAAQKAVSLNPNLSRTQTVLGFVYLTQVRIKESQEAFQKAIERDQADPLPRLGLGLAKIREGGFPKWEPGFGKMIDKGLLEGTREIEIAATLDPDNALIRSYLGKGYYEETRDKLATDQFEMAKTLDPSDPTPYFYEAIHKQTKNRPVEALEDLQKAIELNDNRAVYRSKLLLDSDLAARSASVARIYSDLGFQQRALAEGWKSVNSDPSDFSGHRFLADTYSALPRHEIARVSELLQSQLLQPLNMTPIQPHLAESNLFVLSGAGPGDLSFNEFNPLFNRNGIALQTSGIIGNNATFGEEAIASGIYDKASISVGQYYYKTDGFRTNNGLKDNLFNTFLQYNLFPQTSIQSEFRYRKAERGDLQLRFFRDDFLPNLEQRDLTRSIRLGFNHNLSPSSNLIGNFMYHELEARLNDAPSLPTDFIPFVPAVNSVQFDTDGTARSAELQHLFRSKYFKTVSGAGYFDIDTREKDVLGVLLPIPLPFPPFVDLLQDTSFSRINRDIHHSNLYLYSYLNPLENVTLTIGASGDFYHSKLSTSNTDIDREQLNPKFGITWTPFTGTTVRGAVFKALKRTLITNQTLEPTQVAGFNQFFDDADGTKSWRYGIALDEKFTKALYGGVEYSQRDLEVPFTTQTLDLIPVVSEVNWKERTGRAYLYWTPHNWWALNAEYLYERLDRARRFTDGPGDVETHRVPLGINFYHPCGWSAQLKGTYVSQHGSFTRQGDPQTFIRGDDQFWLFDAAISYRLPKRLGFISVGVKNLFDRSFKYFDADPVNPRIQPDRFIYGKITLALP